MVDFAHVDALAAGYHRRGGQPGLAYGIVAGGELVHAAGLGERHIGGPPPDAGTVFRIASMTKSFTAAAILTLRDDGVLRLDDLAEDYVPELRDWPPVSPDAARISIRHLLTMTAGFPTDDPWGDRQQGLPLQDFAHFLSKGVSFNCAPGTRFEYSNLGYAILGRVITAVTGMAYPDFVRHRLLRPLGMTRTGYEVEEFEVPRQAAGSGGVARGYRRSPGGWSELAFDPAGAFAPMGGVFSCVRDLTRWVAGFAAAFPPGQDDDTHPVRRASRREMQLPQVLTGWAIASSFPGDGASSSPATYGFGLFVDEHPALGRIVSHSGGYPGFGSNMAWHPATGTGVIALGNSTYAAMAPLAARLLEAVLRQDGPAAHGNSVAIASPGPWPETLAAREEVSQLLRSWDDGAAQRLFSPNVAMDAPFEERRRRIALIRERIGEFGDDPGRKPEFDTPAHCRWWLAGERGTRPGADPAQPGAAAPGAVAHAGRAARRGLGAARHAGRRGRLAEQRRARLAPVDPGGRRGRRWPAGPPPADGRRMGGALPGRRLQGGRRHRLGSGRTGRRTRHHHPHRGHRPGHPHPPPSRRDPVTP